MVNFKLSRLAIRFIVIFLVISLVPITTVTIIDNVNLSRTLKHEEFIAMSLIEQIEHSNILQAFENVENNLILLADNPSTISNAKNASTWNPEDLWDTYEGGKWDSENASAITKPVKTWDPSNDLDPDYSNYLQYLGDLLLLSEIFVTDERGYVFANGEALPGDFYQEGESWWNEMLDLEDRSYTYISFDDSLGNYVLTLVVEIVDPETDQFLGMIKAAYNTGGIDQIIDKSKEEISKIEGDEGIEHNVMLIDDSLNIFYHQDHELINTPATDIIPNTHEGNKEILENIETREQTEFEEELLLLMIDDVESYGLIIHVIEDSENHDYGLTILVYFEKALLDSIISKQVLNGVLLAILFGVIAIIAGIFIGIYLSNPIVRLSEVSKELEEGELDVEINENDSRRNDEIGLLARSMSSMVESLKNIVSSSQESSERVASTSEELASTAEEVNATTEEIAATIQQISRGSTTQSDLSAKSIEEINKMSQIIDQALQDIENTLGVIDDIAGQTNILALNAAIEAARAGEHGRGFAVVADNVRKLAEETKKNSSDINKLTETIIQNLGGNIKRLQETFQDLAAQSEEFSASSEEVAAATEEQTAAMHEMTTASQNLSQLGEELSQTISQFKLRKRLD